MFMKIKWCIRSVSEKMWNSRYQHKNPFKYVSVFDKFIYGCAHLKALSMREAYASWRKITETQAHRCSKSFFFHAFSSVAQRPRKKDALEIFPFVICVLSVAWFFSWRNYQQIRKHSIQVLSMWKIPRFVVMCFFLQNFYFRLRTHFHYMKHVQLVYVCVERTRCGKK